MRLELSPAADADLTAIASYIARDNPPRALTFVDELEAACAKLRDFPQSGADRSEIRAGLRSRLHGNTVIFYTVDDTVIRIDRILHGARDFAAALPPN